jgi:hypothetical protein
LKEETNKSRKHLKIPSKKLKKKLRELLMSSKETIRSSSIRSKLPNMTCSTPGTTPVSSLMLRSLVKILNSNSTLGRRTWPEELQFNL